MVRVVEMRFFGGMTAEEIAAAMGRTVPSVNHLLRLAKMWLRRELGGRNLAMNRAVRLALDRVLAAKGEERTAILNTLSPGVR